MMRSNEERTKKALGGDALRVSLSGPSGTKPLELEINLQRWSSD